MFYVSVTFKQDFEFETNSTKTIGIIATEVGDQIKEKTKYLFLYLDAVGLLTGLFFLWIFIRYE
jgi:Zn-dependent membrane protease YugP